MIRLLTAYDGSLDLHLDADTAGRLQSAICVARPRGSVEVVSKDGIIRVHVHSEAAEAPAAHEAIEVK